MIQTSQVDTTRRDLTRLLGRLEHRILLENPKDAEAYRLRNSIYERNKVNANVEHARALLFRIEHDSPQSKGVIPSSSQDAARRDLQEKRALLKRLQSRLDEYAHMEDESLSDSELDNSDDEDLLSQFAPAIPNTTSGVETKVQEKPALASSQAQTAAAAATLSSTLRSRRPGGDSLHPDTAQTTGTSSNGSKSTPSGTTPFKPAANHKSKTDDNTTTNLLEAHDSEQTALTDSLLTLASALKNSTMSFSESLDSSNPIVDAAARALDKNVTGMEAAGQRMGTLRRMTEGRGWWARISLYGWVAGLWVVAILVGLILPKLRF